MESGLFLLEISVYVRDIIFSKSRRLYSPFRHMPTNDLKFRAEEYVGCIMQCVVGHNMLAPNMGPVLGLWLLLRCDDRIRNI